ncbi:MAG: methionine biosynthesis protein MetW [Betaproteobacteria bacterium]|jgi:methionine biosynthesis protein MetW|nr:methionine biosynthesis protein MetW [Betaproteobacteria bacterium]NBS92561.1 methionine biosynthesis protein MetW [Betaproteobacteria bacterium]NBY52628.1 methionine biosynthesis protein MetW [Betaproteobacteria bacterium]NCA23445.1 methionine biosynthesis protein MetW [Betaproteobacteria bacterium]NCU85671.1 methionine biosynthesis protein MetW [Betaproteobacteria bacterium]
MSARTDQRQRADLTAIGRWVREGSRVLDLGCGDGHLLSQLQRHKRVEGYGIDIDIDSVTHCVAAGINVIQSDLERGLSGFGDQAFDYVILSHTLQAMHNTEHIVREMLRVGREGIVSFPNFGYWRHRWQILRGRMPVSDDLPYQWFDTPNIHLCTLRDFELFCQQHGIRILERLVLTDNTPISTAPNLFGATALYRLDALR